MAYLTTADSDTEWLMIGAILVFFMRASGARVSANERERQRESLTRALASACTEAGFALLEVGSIQIKNTKNILVRRDARARGAAREYQ